jgi:hypothetical protein
MLIEASKRPFRHPVPVEALAYYCHPTIGHMYDRPAWGRDSKLYVSNGHIALRFFNFSSADGDGPMAAVDRLLRLQWHARHYEDPKAWRNLDECTLDLFRDGIWPMWREEGSAVRYRTDPCVRVNHGTLAPLASLQAVSRLPRAEIYTTIDRAAPIAFRFNGGEGLIARLTHQQQIAATAAVCHVFARRIDRV